MMKRYFLKYDEFLNEALPLSFAKKINTLSRKDNVEAILKQAFPTKERVYIDLPKEAVEKFNSIVVSRCDSYERIKKLFDENDIEIIDFVNNVAKEPRQKNFTKITKVLSKLKQENFIDMYIKDWLRIELSKNKEQTYKIVISKAKYDIAGMSTDRYWSSCMKLDVKDLHTFGTGGYNSGENSEYVLADIKEGTIIAYLIAGNDTNINSPFGRVLVKPYTSEDDNSMIWFPESVCYGNILNADSKFKFTFKQKVKAWVDRNINSITTKNTEYGTKFNRHYDLYSDGDDSEEIEFTEDRIGVPLQKVVKYNNGKIHYIENYNETGQLHGKNEEFLPNGQLQALAHYNNGEKDGEWKRWHKNGQLWVDAFYKNGNSDGEYKEFSDTGQIRLHGFYKNGNKDGEWKSWFIDGTLSSHTFYKDHIHVGPFKYWWTNGNLFSEGTFKNGKRNGEYKEWYQTGELKEQSIMKDDRFDGEYKEWYKNGQLRIHCFYKDGNIVGEWKLYDEDGVLDMTRIYDEDGNIELEK